MVRNAPNVVAEIIRTYWMITHIAMVYIFINVINADMNIELMKYGNRNKM